MSVKRLDSPAEYGYSERRDMRALIVDCSVPDRLISKLQSAIRNTGHMPTLLLATTNQNKLREYVAIFAGLPFELRSLSNLGMDDDVEETGATFAENARLKAVYYAARSGLPALADDSGLEVAALGGEPGVMSHRYAGPDATDADRNALLLKKLEGVPYHARLARFVCAIALARPPDLPFDTLTDRWVEDPQDEGGGTTEVVEGVLPGVIELAPRGANGFGYDPIFYILDEDATLAELPTERKNQISHRALAALQARAVLERWVAEGLI
jgi:XTP/dITP diphosphohydrolase